MPPARTPGPVATLCPPRHAETLAGLREQPPCTSQAMPRHVSGVNAPNSRQRCVRPAALGLANVRTRHRSSRPAAQEGLYTAGWCEKKKQDRGEG